MYNSYKDEQGCLHQAKSSAYKCGNCYWAEYISTGYSLEATIKIESFYFSGWKSVFNDIISYRLRAFEKDMMQTSQTVPILKASGMLSETTEKFH